MQSIQQIKENPSTAYGYFDDENDYTIEYITEIEQDILNKYSKKDKDCDLDTVKTNKDSYIKDIEKLKEEINKDKTIVVSYEKDNITIKHENDKYKHNIIKRHECIVKHKNKIVEYIKHDIQTSENSLSDYIIAGVALYLARGCKFTNMFPNKIGTVDRGYDLPIVPKDFDIKLKKMAYYASIFQLEELDKNQEAWDDIKLRKLALLYQIKIFSDDLYS